MRIGAFEVDCLFRAGFTLAEVCNGRACVLRFLRIRNVRGTSDSWLRLRLELDGRSICQKAVRGLPVGDEARAAEMEKNLLETLALPASAGTGLHTGRLMVLGEDGEQALPFEAEVLPAHVIPADLERAPLLAAYVRSSDELRSFAAEALQELSDAETVLRGLYDALLSRDLPYQPVPGMRYPDCQEIAAPASVLAHGGSCADLSLLMASLLWSRGLPPALLLFPDHMAVGCLAPGAPETGCLRSPEEMAALARNGLLLPVEITAVCRRRPYEQARQELLDRLDQADACALVNVQQLLRSGMRTVPETQSERLCCPCCGYEYAASAAQAAPICPACLQPFPRPAQADMEDEGSAEIQYGPAPDGAAAVRCRTDCAETLRVAAVWQGRSVRSIGERAFAGCRLETILLSQTIVRVGDYAFLGCRQLRHAALPESLRQIGTGAFRSSGLRTVRIPGGVGRIPRLAFAGCRELKHVEFAEGTQFIDEKAFDGCTGLLTVQLPATMERVARSAFPPGCRLILLSPGTRIV